MRRRLRINNLKKLSSMDPRPYTEAEVLAIARVCHEANRAYCLSLGDKSQPPFEEAPKWQVDSEVLGVKFHLENPNSKPEDSHISWSKQKVADGWKYGKVKDPEAKTHPCLVMFNELPHEQQLKDKLFLSIVRALS